MDIVGVNPKFGLRQLCGVGAPNFAGGSQLKGSGRHSGSVRGQCYGDSQNSNQMAAVTLAAAFQDRLG
uniref:Uncharacterized protein n=1 Tax=Romanomermis culicivorax TaxID=13658 RepID=A0A915KMQ1_ROMCU